MKIEIHPNNNSTWMLGEPNNLIAFLSYLEKGPVEVDFWSLSPADQQHVLQSVRINEIVIDEDYETIKLEWMKKRPAQLVKLQEQEQEWRKKVSLEAVERLAQRQQRLEERKKKFDEKCDYILSLNANKLPREVNSYSDRDLISTLLTMEKQNKNRPSMVKYLTSCLVKNEKRLAQQIAKEAQDQLVKQEKARGKRMLKEETIARYVIESEQETIVLNTDDLIRLSHKPL